MKTLKHCLAALLATLGFAVPASATTFSADYTGLWYRSPAESEAGWGVNVIQQGDVLFVTMFIYDQANQPHWYVASNVNATSQTTFSGQLFNIGSGTYFGAPWSGITGVQAVGNVAFTFNTPTTGSMTFSINNVTVTKQIVRQSWRIDNLTGNYIGGFVGVGGGCGTLGIASIGDLTITHNHPQISTTINYFAGSSPAVCTLTGTYSQVGSMGAINGGTMSCQIQGQQAQSGTFSVSELTNSRNGVAGIISGSFAGCNFTGKYGGIRDVI